MSTTPLNAAEAVLSDSLQTRIERGRSACMRLTLSLAMVVPGVAFAVGLFSLFRIAGADAPLAPLAALAGTATLGYLGTALLSANGLRAALDLGAGVAALWLAMAGSEPQTVAAAFVVHALWGTVRTAIGVRESPHMISNWTAFSSAMALLVLIG
ncbi:MAG: hypothetical protein PVG91_10855 [Gammaproteobacteria bacterium]|jgi:hypothetical protein